MANYINSNSVPALGFGNEKKEKLELLSLSSNAIDTDASDSNDERINDIHHDYVPPEYFIGNLNRLEYYRSKGRMTDVTLRGINADGTESPDKIMAHKIILSLNSRYFEKLFGARGNQKFHYSIPCHVTILKSLIGYMYTGKIPIITEAELPYFISGARLLQLDKISSECSNILKTKVSFENFRHLRRLVGLDSDARESILGFVYSNFEAFSKTKEFLSLDFEEIEEIISFGHSKRQISPSVPNEGLAKAKTKENKKNSSATVTISAETLLKRILEWVQSDICDRQKFLFPLMQNINLGEVPADIVKQCMMTLSSAYHENKALFQLHLKNQNQDEDVKVPASVSVPSSSTTVSNPVSAEHTNLKKGIEVLLKTSNQPPNEPQQEGVKSMQRLFVMDSVSASTDSSKPILIPGKRGKAARKQRSKLNAMEKQSLPISNKSSLNLNPSSNPRLNHLIFSDNSNSSSSMISSPEFKTSVQSAINFLDADLQRSPISNSTPNSNLSALVLTAQQRLMALVDDQYSSDSSHAKAANSQTQSQQQIQMSSKPNVNDASKPRDTGVSNSNLVPRKSIMFAPTPEPDLSTASATTEETSDCSSPISNNDPRLIARAAKNLKKAISKTPVPPVRQKDTECYPSPISEPSVLRRHKIRISSPSPLSSSTPKREGLRPTSESSQVQQQQAASSNSNGSFTSTPNPNTNPNLNSNSKQNLSSKQTPILPPRPKSKHYPVVNLETMMNPTIRMEKLDLTSTQYNIVSGGSARTIEKSVSRTKQMTIRRSKEKNQLGEAPAVKKIRLSTAILEDDIPVKGDSNSTIPVKSKVRGQNQSLSETQGANASQVETKIEIPIAQNNVKIKEEIVEEIANEFVDDSPITSISPTNPLMIFMCEPRKQQYALVGYDFRTKEMATLLENATIDRSKFSMIHSDIEKKLYLIGGRNDGLAFLGCKGLGSMSTILEYNQFPRMSRRGQSQGQSKGHELFQKVVRLSESTPYANMCLKEARSDCGAVTLNNNIYVMGGRGMGNMSLKNVEKLENQIKTEDGAGASAFGGFTSWREIAGMNRARENFGVSVLNDQIYVVGGWTRPAKGTEAATDAVEFYNPELDVWHVAPSLTTKRCGVRTTILDGILYAVGGSSFQDGPNKFNHLETLDPRMSKWIKSKAKDMCMSNSRRDAAVATINGKIYAVGGDDDFFRGRASIEVYDPRAAGWFLDGKIDLVGQFSSVAFMNLNG